jgi:hypothetical protein
MIKQISNWLQRISTGWVTLLALLIFLVFTAAVLPGQSAAAEAIAQGAGSPDLSLTYSREDLYTMAEQYGESGRSAYIRARWTFDLVFPLVYTAFLATAISWLFRRALSESSPWQMANLAPLLGMVFDFLENSAASLVLARYPQQTPVVDALAPAFTFIKWVFVGGSFFLLCLGLLLLAWRWLRERLNPARS